MQLIALPDFPGIRSLRTVIKAARTIRGLCIYGEIPDLICWLGGSRGLLTANLAFKGYRGLKFFISPAELRDSPIRNAINTVLGCTFDVKISVAPIHLKNWRHIWYLAPNCRVPLQERTSGRKNGLRVGWFSRLDYPKRPDIWLKILKVARRKSPKLEAILIGDGQYKPGIASGLPSLGLKHKILSEMQASSAFPLMDVLVFWSDSEGVPLVIQEAIWAGVPVIANDLTGVKALLPGANMGVVTNHVEAAELLNEIDLDDNKRMRLLSRQQQRMQQIAQMPQLEVHIERLFRTRQGVSAPYSGH
jgi:glycosyltransferase involved in cell wall biosynthesis